MKLWQTATAGLTLAAIIGLMVIAEPVDKGPALERENNFSQLDYDVFDRNFKLGDETCNVGLAKHRMCFKDSPLQTQIAKGEKLQQHIPVMVAEFPVLLATQPKAEHQKLLRYGTTLVLMNRQTQTVEDVLELNVTHT